MNKEQMDALDRMVEEAERLGLLGDQAKQSFQENPKEIDKPPLDRWKNRSAEMRCHSCMHYVSKISDRGRCRRHAPTLGGWPVVFETDWCGDHKLT